MNESLFDLVANRMDKAHAAESIGERSDDELMNLLTKGDSLDHIGTVEQSDYFSYYKHDAVGISMSAPHVFGDHIEIEINLRDLQGHFRTDDETWGD